MLRTAATFQTGQYPTFKDLIYPEISSLKEADRETHDYPVSVGNTVEASRLKA